MLLHREKLGARLAAAWQSYLSLRFRVEAPTDNPTTSQQAHIFIPFRPVSRRRLFQLQGLIGHRLDEAGLVAISKYALTYSVQLTSWSIAGISFTDSDPENKDLTSINMAGRLN